MRALAAALLLLLTLPAWAGESSLSWTTPTRQVEEVDAGPLINYSGVKVWQLVAYIEDPTTESFVIPGLKPGTYTFTVSAVTSTGAESRLSTEADKEITEFVVTDTAVKIVAKIPGDVLLLVVGTVPLGTPCDPEVEVKGHYAVPTDQVTWTGAQDILAVAQCG